MSERISADEARRLREAATPGPWTAAEDTLGVRRVYSNGHDWMICTPSANNAALIAAAPDLAALVERLEADNQRLKAALKLACHDAWADGEGAMAHYLASGALAVASGYKDEGDNRGTQ